MTRSPRQHRLNDKLLGQRQSRVDLTIDFAVAPFDEAVREMDRKWGVDRLPALVGPELAAKYGGAVASMSEAIQAEEQNSELVAQWAGVCIRGLNALDAEAERLGCQRADPECWLEDLDGQKVAIVRRSEFWPAVKEKHPDALIYTAAEIVALLKRVSVDLLVDAKQAFPGAEIKEVHNPTMPPKIHDDPIEF